MQETEQKIKSTPKKTKTSKAIIAIIMVIAVVVSFFLGFFTHSLAQSKKVKLINELFNVIDKYAYTDENTPPLTSDDVADILVGGVLQHDKYAEYYSKEDYQSYLNENQGHYTGIGIGILGTTVKSVVLNSPAELGGLKPGDVILEGKNLSTGVEAKFDNTESLTSFLREAQNSNQITFKILRKESGEDKNLDITVVKREYSVCYVKYLDSETELTFRQKSENDLTLQAEITEGEQTINGVSTAQLKSDTAYILLTQFEGDAYAQFAEAMQYFKTRGKTKLILDLRDNGGGSLDILLKIASHLIYNGGNASNTITIAKHKNSQTVFTTSLDNFNKSLAYIGVLANDGTASASEALIGAIDYYKGRTGEIGYNYSLVLTKNSSRGDYSTFGKGIMQTIYNLSNGGAIKLTTAKLFQPNGETSIHGVGLAVATPECQAEDNQTAIQKMLALASPS